MICSYPHLCPREISTTYLKHWPISERPVPLINLMPYPWPLHTWSPTTTGTVKKTTRVREQNVHSQNWNLAQCLNTQLPPLLPMDRSPPGVWGQAGLSFNHSSQVACVISHCSYSQNLEKNIFQSPRKNDVGNKRSQDKLPLTSSWIPQLFAWIENCQLLLSDNIISPVDQKIRNNKYTVSCPFLVAPRSVVFLLPFAYLPAVRQNFSLKAHRTNRNRHHSKELQEDISKSYIKKLLIYAKASCIRIRFFLD